MFLKLNDRYGWSHLYNMNHCFRVRTHADGGSQLYFINKSEPLEVKETADQIQQMMHDYEYEKAQLYKGEDK